MTSKVLVELPGDPAYWVGRNTFLQHLAYLGWRHVGHEQWHSPADADPDDAFSNLQVAIAACASYRLPPLGACEISTVPVFRRRQDLGAVVWEILDEFDNDAARAIGPLVEA
jgi:hypothetical protein